MPAGGWLWPRIADALIGADLVTAALTGAEVPQLQDGGPRAGNAFRTVLVLLSFPQVVGFKQRVALFTEMLARDRVSGI